MVDSFTLSDDGKTYTFERRAGLKFHDGTAVTGADCIASIARWVQKDTLGLEIAKRLDRMEAVDAATFRVVLKEPFPRVLEGLGRMTSDPLFVMPERLAKTPATTELKEIIVPARSSW